MRQHRQIRGNVAKTFIHDQPAQTGQQRQQISGAMGLAIGVVGVDHHRQISARQIGQMRHLLHLPARRTQSCRVFVVGGCQHAGQFAGRGGQLRDHLNRRLGTRNSHHWGGGLIIRAHRCQQRIHPALGWQHCPRLGRQTWHGVGHAVDAGGQIHPTGWCAAKCCDRFINIAAVIAHLCPLAGRC